MATRRSTKEPGLRRDYSDTEYRENDVYDGPQPTKGMYRLKLVNVGTHTNADDNESVKWTLAIVDGEENKHGESVAGWKGSKYTNGEGAKWVEQKLAFALGLIKSPKDTIDMSFKEMMRKAKTCRGLISMERYVPEDGEPEWRSVLTSVFMPDDDGASSAKAKSRRAQEEDEDDDEEDEEPPPASTRSRRSRKAEPEPEPEDEEEDDEDDEEGEEEPDLDALAEELEGLSPVKLKARARELGVMPKRNEKPEDLIDRILEKLEAELDSDEDEDEDEEEEPEPPKPARRGRSATSVRSSGSAAKKRGYSDDPPF